MAQADRHAPAIIAGKATDAVIVAATTYAQAQGELAISTDTERAWIGDVNLAFKRLLHWLDLAYGSCYGNEIGWSQAAAVQNTWYKISDADMADGQLNDVAHDGSGKLTVTYAGKYLVNWAVAVENSANNDHTQVAIAVDGTEQAAGMNHAETDKANAHMTLSGTAILNLAASAYVEISIRTTDNNSPTLGVDHLNVTLVQIGL